MHALGGSNRPIEDAIEQIGNLCQRATTSTETKVQAIETLLDIANLVNETSGWDEGQFTNFDKPDFESQACSWIENAIDTFEPAVRASLFSTPTFRSLMERFGEYDDLASVVEEIEGEMGENEESGREGSSDC
jgi:hypothetical protein